MATRAIQVDRLAVRYRGKNGRFVDAVADLSFYVERGEVVGFLGPNGAGKSSTLKALMGFVPISAGVCEVFGIPAGTVEARNRIGYLPEVALYYPFLTPKETLTLYGELQGLRGKPLRQQVSELLEIVGLAQASGKLNRSLSKGMLQRVGIAQSLLGSPELLVLDEVTSGLDPIGRKELRNLLKQKQQQGATLFFSSHELSEVDMLCDRILLIHKGRLIEERSLCDLKDDLRKYVLNYLGDADLSNLALTVTNSDSGTKQARFRDKASLVAAIGVVNKSGGSIVDVVSQEGSLEDYFVETIGRAA